MGKWIWAHWSFALIVSILPYFDAQSKGFHLDQNIRCLWGGCREYINWLYHYLDFVIKYAKKRASYESSNRTLIIAIPLIDMVAIIYRRVRKGKSPFRPRSFTCSSFNGKSGFNIKTKPFLLITFVSAVCATIGILGEVYLCE